MSRIAIVPARGGSKRIPDKNVVDFFGAPLMSYSIRAAQQSGLFELIHVSTENQRVADVAASLGVPVDFMRDPALADDYTPLLPVLRWVLEQYARRGHEFDTVCLLMPTAPLIEAADLRKAEEIFKRHGGQRTVMAVARISVPVEWAFRMAADGGLAPCQPGMAAVRSQDLQPAYCDSGTFIFMPGQDVLRGQIDASPMIGFELPRYKAIDIDDAEDLELARVIFRGLQGGATETRRGESRREPMVSFQEKAFVNGEGNAWYHRNKHKSRRDAVLPLLIKHDVRPSSVMEFGCSDGWRLNGIKQHFQGVTCYGVDPSRDAINDGRARHGDITLYEGTAALAQQDTRVFSLMIFGFCLYVTDPSELSGVVARADRALDVGGHLVIHDFDSDHPHRVKYEHKEGLFSWKMDYSKLWLANPQYKLIDKVKPDKDTAVWLLRKNSIDDMWPVEELVR
jgi:N-acylneuraminate cytidylyltransferase